MKTVQKGLTFIELMFVILIIAILALVAIPSYTDYLQRSKVSETLLLLASMKGPVLEFAAANDSERWPSAPGSISAMTAGKYSTNISINVTGKYLSGELKASVINGSVILDYDTTTKIWTCTHNGMEVVYLPANCRVAN
jgi:type IV pilus assembly protein PilA